MGKTNQVEALMGKPWKFLNPSPLEYCQKGIYGPKKWRHR